MTKFPHGSDRLRMRVLPPLLAAIALLTGAFVWHIVREEARRDGEDIAAAARDVEALLHRKLESAASTMQTVAVALMRNPELERAFGTRDRATLLRLAQPVYQSLCAKNAITHFYFHGPDRVNFLRVHAPASNGDRIDRTSLTEAERTGLPQQGVECGPIGTFVLRSVVPWREDGVLLGYLELGKEFSDIAVELRTMRTVELVVAVEKQFLERERWEAALKRYGRSGTWDEFPRHVVMDKTLPEVPPAIARHLRAHVAKPAGAGFTAEMDGRTCQVFCLPMKDISERVVGRLIVLRDVTEARAAGVAGVRLVLGVSLGVAALLVAFFTILLGRVERDLTARAEGLRAANAELAGEVAERKQMADALHRSQERLQLVLDSTTDGFWDSDFARNEMYWSDRLYDLLGFERGGARPSIASARERIHPDDRPAFDQAVAEAIREGKIYALEVRIVRPDGAVRWVSSVGKAILGPDGACVRMTGTVTELTERKALEEQLRQAQKMEAIGLLAGGVAHDFNNLLTVINGYAELLVAGAQADAPARPKLEEILKAGRRAADLTRQLLAFSRKSVVKPVVLDATAVVNEMAGLLRRLIGSPIELCTSTQPGVWPIRLDPGQMHQILLNLAVNARDAMPEGGTLHIGLMNRTISTLSGWISAGQKIGDFVQITVRDTGTGMDAATRARIFEPFFTTKKDKGTGLGLSTVYGIVQQAGGTIEVESEPGRGTTFRIDLPRSTSAVVAAPPPASAAKDAAAGTVLLVEDDAPVRGMVEAALCDAGYTVLTASDGREALRILATRATPVDLVLTDLSMPGMSGRDLIARLRQERPGLRTMLMSGYAEGASAGEAADGEASELLQKPFGPGTAVRRVRAAIRGAGRA